VAAARWRRRSWTPLDWTVERHVSHLEGGVVTASAEEIFAELSQEMGAGRVNDPYPVFAERRRTTPVGVGDVMSEFGVPSMAASVGDGRPLFTFYRYSDVVGALRDADTYSNSLINEVFEPFVGRTVLGMDGEEHRIHRGLYLPAFTRRLVEMWQESVMRPVARELAADLAARPEKRANLVEFALRFTVQMIYQIIGLPEDDEIYERFARNALTVNLASMGVRTDPEETKRANERARAAGQDTYETLCEVVRLKRETGADGDDLICRVMRSEFEGTTMTDEQVATFIRSTLTPASETTTRSWLNVMLLLLQRPDVLEELRNDRSLILRAIDEGMRFEPTAVAIGRNTVKDTVVRGVEIPAGSGVTLVMASANRDEEAFENPDVFDIHAVRLKPTLVFGHGPHICPGMNTARMEMRETIDALLDALPHLRLDPDVEPPAVTGLMMRSANPLHVVWG
jgi:cytochrome P450